MIMIYFDEVDESLSAETCDCCALEEQLTNKALCDGCIQAEHEWCDEEVGECDYCFDKMKHGLGT